jgi:hypothetical protein
VYTRRVLRPSQSRNTISVWAGARTTGEVPMSNEIAQLRKQAADAFRAARRSTSALDREIQETKARSFRLLAKNEEWLQGRISRRKFFRLGAKGSDGYPSAL